MTCAFTVLHFAIVPWVWGANGELTLSLVDAETGNPVAARVVLRRVDPRNADRADSAPLVKPPKSIPAGVGVAVDGTAVWKLPEGTYRFEIIRGPEHRVVTVAFKSSKIPSARKPLSCHDSSIWSLKVGLRVTYLSKTIPVISMS